MRGLVEAFLSIPVGGRAAVFAGALLVVWCILGRPLLKIASVFLWLFKKLFLGVYVLIEIPVSALHSKFGGPFGKIDQGLAIGTEKICNIMDHLCGKARNPRTIHRKRALLIYIVLFVYLVLPVQANLTAAPFTFWQKTYINIETRAVYWVEDKFFASIQAKPSDATFYINGQNTQIDAYEIHDSTYFKLRDLAYALNGTDAQFSVTWNGTANKIELTRKNPYTAIGGEQQDSGTGAQEAIANTSAIEIDGKAVAIRAYTIGGNSYFKLRDIGQHFNFFVSWDSENNAIAIDTKKAYIAD